MVECRDMHIADQNVSLVINSQMLTIRSRLIRQNQCRQQQQQQLVTGQKKLIFFISCQ